jgi:hypothetical protein
MRVPGRPGPPAGTRAVVPVALADAPSTAALCRPRTGNAAGTRRRGPAASASGTVTAAEMRPDFEVAHSLSGSHGFPTQRAHNTTARLTADELHSECRLTCRCQSPEALY